MPTSNRTCANHAVSDEALNKLLLAQEESEDQRLLEKSRRIQQANEQYSCKEDNETTPWLQHTGWPVLHKNRPLDILTASALPPSKRPTDDYYLGRWSNSPVESPRANEAKLQLLMCAVDRMFERAHKTLDRTHYRLRCWLQTYHRRHFRPVAFKRLGTEASRAGYIAIWKQFICYVFRSWATPTHLRSEIYGVTFQLNESRQMEYIWSTLLEEVIDPSDIDQSQDGDFENEFDDDDGTECNSESGSDSNSKIDDDEECFNEDVQDYDSNRGDEELSDQLDRDLDTTLPEESCK